MSESTTQLTGEFQGRYFIEREIAGGATAVVYLARDTVAGRPVAIKMLRRELSAALSSERFLREIRVTAGLRHPRILPLLDSGSAGDRLYCVLPYMDGGTLRARLIRHKQLPIDDVLRIGIAIAQALDAAHSSNIVHRDVKPENILFAGDEPVLADFGIARAIERAADDVSTSTGIVRGTLAYMSPEQATGERDYDGRSDIYSLACVLYEAVSGMQPFVGPTPQSVVLQRLSQQPPPLSLYRPRTSRRIEEVINRALATAPADRFQTAREFASALEAARMDLLRGGPDSTALPAWQRHAKPAALLLAALAATIAGVALLQRRDATERVVTFSLPPPDGVQFTQDLRNVIAVSPDGRDIIFAGTDSTGERSLWIRPLADRTARRIPGTEGGEQPFWSPDGRFVGFLGGRQLTIVGREGGARRSLSIDSMLPRGATWGTGGEIFFAPGSASGIFVADPTLTKAGQVTVLDTARGEIGHMWPQALGGGLFLYYVASDVDSVRGIHLGSTGSGGVKHRIVGSAASGVYADRHLLYVRDGDLMAQEFELRSRKLVGEPRLIADSVATSHRYYGVFSASNSGVLAYASGRARDISRLQWIDSSGARGDTVVHHGYFRNPILSPDGRYLAFESFRETSSEIRVVDLITGASRSISGPTLQSQVPVWSPSGGSIAFVAQGAGFAAIYRADVHGASSPEFLFNAPRFAVLTDWAPDDALILTERNDAGDYDLIARPLGAAQRAIVLSGGPRHQADGRVSPGGRFIAYVSAESGPTQVYVQRYGGGKQRCQVSVGGGWQPVWGSRAGQLFYLSSSGELMEASVDLTGELPCPVAPPRMLFHTAVREPASARSHFDVSRTHGRFLFRLPSSEDDRAWLTVMVNWLAAVTGSS